jgi:GNAT superfamily N-acetyltransferase
MGAAHPKSGDGVQVRRVGPPDWLTLRDVRLRALAESPWAFGSTLTGEAAEPEAFWHDWAEDRFRDGVAATYLATEGPRAVGMAAGFPAAAEQADDGADGGAGPAAMLIGMWVDPSSRGRGAGRRLVDAVIEWARAQGAAQLRLWVTETNGAARALYERTGFVPTGGRKPLPSDPSLMEAEMALLL